MLSIDLNGLWHMKGVKHDEWLEARVPGTVYADLLRASKVPDPYYRDNEDKIAPVFDEDYEVERQFDVTAAILAHDRVLLCFEGLDTLTEITVNGKFLAETSNMHRTYEFDVKEMLAEGVNTVHVLLKSSTVFLDKFAGMSAGVFAKRSIQLLRKAQCAFGWDWGMSLPDAGIWKPVSLKCYNEARIDSLQIIQNHNQGAVALEFKPAVQAWCCGDLALDIDVAAPDGSVQQASVGISSQGHTGSATMNIKKPRLWWPNGYGSQPLYTVNATLRDGDRVLDTRTMRIGLRTIELRREKDQWGRSYEFIINGQPIYMAGSNLIIEDSVLGRVSRERTTQMIKNSIAANMNCIRVWGGANYPQDYFYDLCDEYGIVLYHDFMFACTFYPADEGFIANVRQEAVDNIKKLRHHACMGLWSGNNEVEMMFTLCTSPAPEIVKFREALGIPDLSPYVEKFQADYDAIFKDLLPSLLKDMDPQASYVTSSPSVHPDDLLTQPPEAQEGDSAFAMQSGDAHYYVAYDSLSPYTKQRSLNFRFVSEMGFQSYPDIKTIETFTEPGDRRPDSDIMYKHQKCKNGNQSIELYMNEDYKKPADFRRYVYTSQIMAGEVLKYAVEHFRRNRGRNMGVLLWQLNDCWPVVSWSGVDYFGRWKAQQYYTKRFFSPVLATAQEDGVKVSLHITNDTLCDVTGILSWSLRDNRSVIAESGEQKVIIAKMSAGKFIDLDFSSRINEANRGNCYLEFTLTVDGEAASSGTVLFVKPKDFNFIDPKIRLEFAETADEFIITASSFAFAKSVMLYLEKADCIFSDNFFDLSAGAEKTVTVSKADMSEVLSLAEFRRQITSTSVYDIDRG